MTSRNASPNVLMVRRSRYVLAAFAVGFGALVLFWLLDLAGTIDGLGDSYLGLLFPAFALPASLWATFLAVHPAPMIEADRDRVVLRGSLLPWRTATIQWNDVLHVYTEWEGPNSESFGDAIFVLMDTGRGFDGSASVFRLTSPDRLYYDLASSELDPTQGSIALENMRLAAASRALEEQRPE